MERSLCEFRLRSSSSNLSANLLKVTTDCSKQKVSKIQTILVKYNGKHNTRYVVCSQIVLKQWRARFNRSMPASLACQLLLILLALSFTGLYLHKIRAVTGSNVIYVKVGALFEESDHEQANMLIRTIKMINERRDETIRQLLNISTSNIISSRQQKGAQSEIKNEHIGQQYRKLTSSHLEPTNSNSNNNNDSGVKTWITGDDGVDGESPIPLESHSFISAAFKNPSTVKLEPMIEFLGDRHSSFEADSKVCQLIESCVHAIVGPTDGASIQHVQSICDNMEIPYFELRPFLGSPTAPSFISNLASSYQQQQQQQQQKSIVRPTNNGSSVKVFWSDAQQLPLYNGDNSGNGSPSAVESGGHRNEMDHAVAVGSENGNLAENVELPHNLASQAAPTTILSNVLEDLTMNLYPPAYLLTSAYIDLINAWNWTSFAIVYEDGNSMIKLQDLFRESSGTWTSKWQIKLFQFSPSKANDKQPNNNNNNNKNNINNNDQNHNQINIGNTNIHSNTAPPGLSKKSMGEEQNISARFLYQTNEETDNLLHKDANSNIIDANNTMTNNLQVTSSSRSHDTLFHFTRNRKKRSTFRDIFWSIRRSGEQNILLDVKTENLYEALKQAQQVGCMTERYSYLVTSLDLHTIDLEDFKYSRTRITAFNIIQVARFQQPAYRDTRDNIESTPIPTATTTTTTTNKKNVTTMHRRSSTIRQIEREKLSIALFDEKYLEKLGVHVIQGDIDYKQSANNRAYKSSGINNQNGEYYNNQRQQSTNRQKLSKLSPSIVLDRSGSFMDPPSDVYKDWSKRDMLISTPASMSLLPSVDRDSEQKLFEFFIDQQERNISRVRLSTSSAILHDSLILYMLGLNELDPNGNFVGEQQAIACSLDSQPWLHGSSLVNYMRRISFNGLTGTISFDQRGLRSDFKLDMMGMAPDIGLIKVGEWHSKHINDPIRASKFNNGSDYKANNIKEDSKSYDELSSNYELELKKYNKMIADGVKVPVPYTKPMSRYGALMVNEIIFGRLYREQADQIDTLIVTTKLSQPYFMLKETPNKLEGNEQYEGFAVDLIHELSKLVNFNYRWKEVADKKYGSKEVLPNGTVVWNGMIGEIVRGQADLAIVDLTITAQREEAVDFTLPFMNTGISILFKKPTTKVTTLFSFLSPFSSDVWAYVLAAYCGISAVLFLVGHLSPYEWANPHPCRHSNDDDETVLKNQFSILNSFWFTIGSLMQQGSDLTPRSMSTRTIAGIWYFFTLIMISSYTANLAAFLTVEKVVYPIENVRDLSNQQEIKYGCVESGSTCTFFHDSQIDTYKRINETMRKFRTYVRSNDEGQKRVEEGKFAFFMESASIEYIVERNCNLTQIGGLLDSKGYGLATSKKSHLKRSYRTLLSEGILHLQETGMLHILKNRWWKERRGGGTCTDDGKGGGVTELSLANVGGVFVVLLGCLGISFLVAIAEFMWCARRSGSTRDRMCEEMMSDLKFALACKRSTKPVVTRGNCNGDGDVTGNGSRGRLAHQQSSLVSQSDETEPESGLMVGREVTPQGTSRSGRVNNNTNTKDCDPILLHAMLTMLMQQQHQTTHYLGNIDGDKQQVVEGSNVHYRDQVPNNGGFVQGAPQNSTGTKGERISELEADGYGDIRRSRSNAARHQCQWLASRSEAVKRRLLFAQQTIDTSDDSFMGQLDIQRN